MNAKELELTNRLANTRKQREKTSAALKESIQRLINKADSVNLHNIIPEYNDALRDVSKADGILEALVQMALITLPEYERLNESIIGAEARINYLLNEKRRLYRTERRTSL